MDEGAHSMKFLEGMRVELIDRTEIDRQAALHNGCTVPVEVGDIGRVKHDQFVDGLFEVVFPCVTIVCNAAMVNHVPTGVEKEAAGL